MSEWCLFAGRLRVRRINPETFKPLFSERYGHTRWHWLTRSLAWRVADENTPVRLHRLPARKP